VLKINLPPQNPKGRFGKGIKKDLPGAEKEGRDQFLKYVPKTCVLEKIKNVTREGWGCGS